MQIEDLIDILHKEKCSCVIYNSGKISLFYQRGVKDLYDMLTENPEHLRGSLIADKVIGKGAAAILAVGKINTVYADIISRPALELLKNTPDISVTYDKIVNNIMNRSKTGLCPVEQLCLESPNPNECVKKIGYFINLQNHHK